MALKALFLDFYGTLVEEDDDILPILCEQVRIHAADPEALTAHEISHRWWEILKPLYVNAHHDAWISHREVSERSIAMLAEELGATGADLDAILAPQYARWGAPPIFPETHGFLDAVRALGVPIGIVSNIDRADIELALAHHGIVPDVLVTSEDARAYKPRPEMFTQALAAFDLAPHEVLHVGDSRTSDIAGATPLGIPVAWINRTGKVATSAPVADHEVTDLRDLLPIIADAIAAS